MRIGLTFFLTPGRSIWANGAAQHCAFLLETLRRVPGAEVVALNGGEDVPAPASMLLDGVDFERVDDAVGELDLLVEAGAQVSAANVARVRERGGRAVTLKFGNAFVIDAERVIHGKPPGSVVNGARFDEVWTNAQHVETCSSFWAATYRCPVRVLPHVWSPTFVERAVSEFPLGLAWGWRPREGKQRVAVFEPNANIVKTCFVPLLACELLHRARPELLGEVWVMNALALKEHETFSKWAGSLDVVRDNVASFEGRHCGPWMLAAHADAVVAHQWENGLNYAYYEALHGGWPLVHNSPLLPDGVGYRYRGFDAHHGAEVLAGALDGHAARLPEYEARARAFLATVSATTPENVAAHARAIEELFARG